MIDDDHRGYLLELAATKLLTFEQDVQIVGMSATLSVCPELSLPQRSGEGDPNTEPQNIDTLAKWLNAHTYQTLYRPVPIDEHLVYDSNIYVASSAPLLLKAATQPNAQSRPTLSVSSPARVIQPSSHKELQDPVLNAVVALANETVRAGYGVLIFCSSRSGCESDARIISHVLPDAGGADPAVTEKREDLLDDLRSLPSGIDPVLAETIPSGVAFHREYSPTMKAFSLLS